MKAAFTGALSAAIILGLVAAIVYWRHPGFMSAILDDKYLLLNAAEAARLSNEETIAELLKSGVVIQPDRFYEISVAFYETMIVILVSLLGATGIFSIFYSRVFSRAKAEEIAEEGAHDAVQRFLRDNKIEDHLKGQLDKMLDEQLTEIKDSLEGLPQLADRIDSLEDRIGDLDFDERGYDEEIAPEEDQ